MQFLIPRRLAAVGISAGILLLAAPATVLAHGGTHASSLNVGSVQLGTSGGSLVESGDRNGSSNGRSALNLDTVHLGSSGGSLVQSSDRHGRSELHVGSVDLG